MKGASDSHTDLGDFGVPAGQGRKRDRALVQRIGTRGLNGGRRQERERQGSS
jgi:hypothetical protein